MRYAHGPTLAFHKRVGFEGMVRTAVSRVRPRMSHPDNHIENIAIYSQKDNLPADIYMVKAVPGRGGLANQNRRLCCNAVLVLLYRFQLDNQYRCDVVIASLSDQDLGPFGDRTFALVCCQTNAAKNIIPASYPPKQVTASTG